MFSMRLKTLASRHACNNLLRGLIDSRNLRTFQTDKVPKSDNSEEDAENDEPIQYSTSPAATWAAEHSQRGEDDDAPWFQTHIINVSLLTFMVYFFILREPNDIDKKFDMELGDHFKHIDMDAVKTSAGVPISSDRNNNN